jgi:hypothetical protein
MSEAAIAGSLELWRKYTKEAMHEEPHGNQLYREETLMADDEQGGENENEKEEEETGSEAYNIADEVEIEVETGEEEEEAEEVQAQSTRREVSQPEWGPSDDFM